MRDTTTGPRQKKWPMAVALAVWAGALILAFYAQDQLWSGTLGTGVLLYALAGSIGAVGMAVIDRSAPLPTAETPPVELGPWGWQSPRGLTALALLIAGLAATTGSVAAVVWRAYGGAFWLWVTALVLVATALAVGSRRRWEFRLPPIAATRLGEIAIVLLILTITVALRLPNLSEIPPEVHGDEAACGLQARRILGGEVPNLFHVGWYHIPYLSFAISAAFMKVFGNDLFGLRTASVFLGTASVLLLYLVVRQLFTVRVAALAAFLLAISHWHIHFSRSGINYMQAVFATLLLFYLLLLGLQRGRALHFLLAGFAAGLCMNVYYAARLAPVLAACYVVHRIISERGFFSRHWPGLLAVVLGFVVFLAPMGVVFAKHSYTLLSRTRGVFVLTPKNLERAKHGHKVDDLAGVLRVQFINTISAFSRRGETSGQHGHRAPLIDYWTGALFVVGIAAVTWRVRRPRYFLVALWFWLTLILGGVLTIDPLFSPRVIAAVPVLFVFPALVIDAGWRGLEWFLGRTGTYLFALPVGIFLILATRANYQDYFELHIKLLQPARFYTVLAHYVQSINDRYRVYFLGKRAASLRYDTAHFLVPDVDGVNVRDNDLPLPLDRVPAEKGVAFVVALNAAGADDRLRAIQNVYPNGKTTLLSDSRDRPLFHIHLVEHDQLFAANPGATIDKQPIPALELPELTNGESNAQAEPTTGRHGA